MMFKHRGRTSRGLPYAVPAVPKMVYYLPAKDATGTGMGLFIGALTRQELERIAELWRKDLLALAAKQRRGRAKR